MRFRINEPSVIHQTIDGELVIIHLDNGVYYSVDGSGAQVWAMLASGASTEEIVEALRPVAGDGVAVDQAINEFVERLLVEKLLVEATDGAADLPPGALDGAQADFAPPVIQRYDDLQDLLLLDPIHAVDESGWPERREPA